MSSNFTELKIELSSVVKTRDNVIRAKRITNDENTIQNTKGLFVKQSFLRPNNLV